MTITSSQTNPTSIPAPAPDPRELLAKAVVTGATVIAGVSPGQMGDPTPCDQYDVRGLLGHLVTVLDRIAAIGRGDNPFGVAPVTGIADDGWLTAWSLRAGEAIDAWADDASLTRIVRVPWSELPGAATLGGYLNEITVHTWDIATATGQQPVWDDEVLGVAFAAIRHALPADGRAAALAAAAANVPAGVPVGPPPFADAVPVADAAPLIDRLVAWNGRRP